MPQVFLVSSCLVGRKCAYDGESRHCPAVIGFLNDRRYVEVCPEIEGGFSSPRETHEIVGGTGDDVLDGKARVVSVSGRDRTRDFLLGAERALEIAKENNASSAVMKSKSPSCGKCRIYDGSFKGVLRDGHGVTTALLARNGLEVLTEKEI